jgi:hypothetical protein
MPITAFKIATDTRIFNRASDRHCGQFAYHLAKIVEDW